MAAKTEYPTGSTAAQASTNAWVEILTTPNWLVTNLIVTLEDNAALLRFGSNDDSVIGTGVNGIGMSELQLPPNTLIEIKSAVDGEHAASAFLSVWQKP